MANIDKRGKLDEEVFSYRDTKDGRVLLSWNGKHIKAFAGKEARKLLGRIEGLDGKSLQLALAKVAGNFKRGNERRRCEGENT